MVQKNTQQKSRDNQKPSNIDDFGTLRVIKVRDLVRWFFVLDNFKLALAILGIILTITFNEITHMSRLKGQLSDSFRTIEEMRDKHIADEARLNEKLLHFKNKVDVLESEVRIYKDSLEYCRSEGKRK